MKGEKYTGYDLDTKIHWHNRNHDYSTSNLRKRVFDAEVAKRDKYWGDWVKGIIPYDTPNIMEPVNYNLSALLFLQPQTLDNPHPTHNLYRLNQKPPYQLLLSHYFHNFSIYFSNFFFIFNLCFLNLSSIHSSLNIRFCYFSNIITIYWTEIFFYLFFY